MKYSDILLTANANLRISKVRTFLTISAVFIGALTLMLTSGVGAGLKSYVDEQVGAAGAEDALIIFADSGPSGPVSNDEAVLYDPGKSSGGDGFGATATLNGDDLKSIGERPEILSIDPLYPLALEYMSKDADSEKYQGNISQVVEGLNIPMRAGRIAEARSDSHEIVLAPAFVQALGFESDEAAVGETVLLAFKDLKGEVFTQEATISGVQETTIIQGNAMNVNISFAQDTYERSTRGLPEFQSDQYPAAVAKFDTNVSDQDLESLKMDLGEQGYSAQTLDDQLGIITSVIDGITTFLNVFAAIALLAATFGIVNTLLMAVQERTREIGLMKALGMGRKKIFALFSLEAILIGFWGAILALIAANIIGRIVSNIASETVLSDFEGLQLFSFPASAVIPVILLIMTIAFLAGTLPARRASRLDPIEALRYE